MSFLIASLHNPYSTNISDSFIATLMSPEGFAIAKQSSGLSISVTEGSKFGNITIERGSERNGKLTWYKFKIVLTNPAPSGSKMIIAVPDKISIRTLDGVFMDCSGGGNLMASIECKLINRKVQVDLVT